MSEPKLYLLDVEGTVAPVSFVTQTLFPYARKHFAESLTSKLSGIAVISNEGGAPRDDSVLKDLWMLLGENWAEQEAEAPRIVREVPPGFLKHDLGTSSISISTVIFVPRALEYIYWLMDRDRKSTALKSLQGKIWKEGYERGELKSELFDDVPEAFASWSKRARVAIYSSGSAEAQEMFFRYSNHGDLTPMISGYFDTRTGPKQESASYAAIAAATNTAAEDVLFFSDVVGELDAARGAGCGTRLVVRPGNAPLSRPSAHAVVQSLDQDSRF
jgi:2,3-diketo-5-methylthio-1-phosphopentane phosphatase